jgi:hypothetical protein
MDNTLDAIATKAEKAVSDAVTGLIELRLLRATDFSERLDQIRKRDAALADALSAFQSATVARLADAAGRLMGEASTTVPSLISPTEDLHALGIRLKIEKDALEKASDIVERNKLVAERNELEDRRILAANRPKLTARRDLLMTDAAYAKALAEVRPRASRSAPLSCSIRI